MTDDTAEGGGAARDEHDDGPTARLPVDEAADDVGVAPTPDSNDASERVAHFKRAIEATILVAHEPVAPELLAQLLEQPRHLIEQWCDELTASYRERGHGFELARVAGGYRFQTAAELAAYVERFLLHDQRARLSGAALETLAIVAYRQPICGVDPDGVLRTLMARGYVGEIGRDDGPGQALLFGTTPLFLERLGLDTLDDLPPIAEFIPDAEVVEALEVGLGGNADSRDGR